MHPIDVARFGGEVSQPLSHTDSRTGRRVYAMQPHSTQLAEESSGTDDCSTPTQAGQETILKTPEEKGLDVLHIQSRSRRWLADMQPRGDRTGAVKRPLRQCRGRAGMEDASINPHA